jgi:hypothetical protein
VGHEEEFDLGLGNESRSERRAEDLHHGTGVFLLLTY